MKKLISIILTLAMFVSVFAVFPMTASAANELMIAGTSVDVSDGIATPTSGTGWTLTTPTSTEYTLTLTSGFAGEIEIGDVDRPVNIVASENVTVVSIVSSGYAAVTISGSGELNCTGDIYGDGVSTGISDILISGCTVNAANIKGKSVKITDSTVTTTGSITTTNELIMITDSTVEVGDNLRGKVTITDSTVTVTNSILNAVTIVNSTVTTGEVVARADVSIGNGSTVNAASISGNRIEIADSTVSVSRTIVPKGSLIISSGTIDAEEIYPSSSSVAVSINGGNIKGIVDTHHRIYPTEITLSGASAGTSVSAIAGVGSYGIAGIKTLDTNKLYLYLPEGTTVTQVTAGGKTYYGSITSESTAVSATFVRHVSGAVSIAGTVAVGTQLTASVPNADPSDAAFTYKWYRDNKQGAELASGTTYTPVEADIGKKLICVASCTNYLGSVTDAQTAAVPKYSETAIPATPTTLAGGVGESYITAGSTGTAGKTIELQLRKADGTTVVRDWTTQTGSAVTFSGLAHSTSYKVYARYQATVTKTNGPDSPALSVTTTARTTPIDPVSSNMIYGIYDGNVLYRNRAVSFIAIGGGMDNAAPIAGDTRYVPINWFVNPSGVWVTAPYYATIPANSLTTGWHTLTVTYRRQIYDGARWANVANAPQTVATSVTFYITGSNNPVTGDNEQIWLYAGMIAGVMLMAGSAVAISVRRRKNTQ